MPRLLAKACQTDRPTAIPTGTPITIPTRATVVVCQATAKATCRRTKPRALEAAARTTPDHAQHQDVQESGGAEQDQDRPEEEWEIHRLTEVHQVGGWGGKRHGGWILPGQLGLGGVSLRPGHDGDNFECTASPDDRLDETGAKFRARGAFAGVGQQAAQVEHCSRAQPAAGGGGRQDNRSDYPERAVSLGAPTGSPRPARAIRRGRRVGARWSPQRDFAAVARKPAADRGGQQRAAQTLTGDGSHHLAVDVGGAGDAGGDGSRSPGCVGCGPASLCSVSNTRSG